ncbi:hypothetical protein O53_1464 [Microcystis aeruginosa TAIHU98]|uniref:Uncharacterized protein n=2 Tax=Microcystis aeruginosa TaxID=1126 RepID=L7EDQ7_MICAE|nr:hypothetical protein BH695_1567 [Microcystis aeruginosa PCC 7806SL]ELP56853.1 hypothetical protein O53_1464 [Microcystis aeruginosa TAIHU98]ODV36902.1 hypothetical protein BFG60_3557 [Microcystis aeruginosa NIES-98]
MLKSLISKGLSLPDRCENRYKYLFYPEKRSMIVLIIYLN